MQTTIFVLEVIKEHKEHVVTRFVTLIEYGGLPKNISAGRSSKSASECPSDAFLFKPHPPCLEPSKNQPPDQNPTTTVLFKSYYNLRLLNVGNIHRPAQKTSSKLLVPAPSTVLGTKQQPSSRLKSYPNVLFLELGNIHRTPQKHPLNFLFQPHPTCLEPSNNHPPD